MDADGKLLDIPRGPSPFIVLDHATPKPVLFADKLTLDAPRKTSAGYLVARARAARTGVYRYAGYEIDPQNEHGLRDKAIVNVLRDENTVFDKAAVQSFIGKPITDDHPREAVTADNWRDHARGTIMGALRDGEYLAFDLLLTDSATIQKVDEGKRELSNGYAADLEFGTFTAPDGTVCDARQSKITGGNHVALVDAGRAGSDCRIADAATCEGIPREHFDALLQRTYSPTDDGDKNNPTRREPGFPKGAGNQTQDGDFRMTKITIDGLLVDLSDVDAVNAALAKKDAAIADAITAKDKAATDLAAAQTALAAKDTEIAELTAKLADAAITPAKLRDAAKVYADTAAKAKALGVAITEDADVDAIMKAVVDAKMGELAKDWTAEQIAASFAVLAKDSKPAEEGGQQLADALATAKPVTTDQQVTDAYQAMVNDMTSAWKRPELAA
jgi:Uncharacterized protein conserved in bacteria